MNNQRLIHERKSSKPSKGEKIVMKVLRQSKIKFIREHYRDDLRNDITGHLLFFDFYLPRHNLVIEVDGAQHFEAINGEAKLRSQQYRDSIKDQYCEDNGITMLRLTYNDLRPPMAKLTRVIGGVAICSHPHKIKKRDRKQIQKSKKKRPVKIKRQKWESKAPNLAKKTARLAKSRLEFEASLELKRNAARLNYPTDIRIDLAERYSKELGIREG